MSEFDLFSVLHLSKGVNALGELVWALGRVEEAPEARLRLGIEGLRQLFDTIGVELRSCTDFDSEVLRLQEENLNVRVAYKKLQEELDYLKALIGGRKS